MKGDCPPASGLQLERNGGSKRSAVLSPDKGEEPGRGRAVRVGGTVFRHKLLPNSIGPGQEQDLQRLADELGRFPLEQTNANGLRGNDAPGLVNRHGERSQSKLSRGHAGGRAGSRPNGVGLGFREGRRGGAGTPVLAYSVHKVATQSLAAREHPG